ncbi:MAG TPA: ABC transporter ATP-binding protein [Chloroflexota bacterium]|jgi:branched-chain amino acid transport system ATP-binding protein|nr:ABC transporter ATP-binding protein [Chloroflexota bacterium]
MLLELKGVTRSFGGLTAVKGVNLSVASGDIVGLIGPNGAGKTTLFNLITGTYRPNTGSVLFDGRDVTRLEPYDRCKAGIARTFQLVRPFPNASLLDNVAVGRVYGREPAPSRRAAEAEALMVLERLGLHDRAQQPAKSLTLVDRKRLELARALATNPRLLLLDELLAGLNPSEVAQSMDLVRSIRDSGVTIVMVEHLVKALFGVSDRVAVLSAGEKICEGSPRDVAQDARVIDAYLGPGRAESEAVALA